MICPPGTTQVDTFSAAGLSWLACEDLRLPGGGITLVPERGAAVHLPKSYEPYSPEPDDYYYLGLGKDKVLGARWDMLGDAVINECPTKTSTTKMCEPTWQRVERALPVVLRLDREENDRGEVRRERLHVERVQAIIGRVARHREALVGRRRREQREHVLQRRGV